MDPDFYRRGSRHANQYKCTDKIYEEEQGRGGWATKIERQSDGSGITCKDYGAAANSDVLTFLKWELVHAICCLLYLYAHILELKTIQGSRTTVILHEPFEPWNATSPRYEDSSFYLDQPPSKSDTLSLTAARQASEFQVCLNPGLYFEVSQTQPLTYFHIQRVLPTRGF